ncbi:MAG: DNA repair protein RecN [Planctomycetota bacterium]
MLRELHISNLAVIEDATVELGPGLNVFTGQTGAGKSLVMGAIELLLGLRSGSGMLRDGADQGRVTGLFELGGGPLAEAVAGVVDQPVESCGELLVTRKLFASGRTGVSINGRPATAAMVRAVGQRMVDIHGQHDHQLLLRGSEQRAAVDAYAGVGGEGGLLETYRQAWERWRGLSRRAEELAESAELRRQKLDLAEFQAGEIDAARPTAGELPELEARHAVLANLATIKGRAGQVIDAMSQGDGAIVGRLEAMTLVLRELAELDEGLTEVAEAVRGATLALGEAGFDLGRRVDRLEADPGELAEVEDRLNTLNRLVSKYGDRWSRPGRRTRVEAHDADECQAEDAIAPVLRLRAELGEEIDRLRGEDDALDGIEEDVAMARVAVDQHAAALTAKRVAAAREMNPRIEAELGELGMAGARFEVAVMPRDEGPGPSGADRVEMRVATNVGQTYKPLADVASGGELSRVMLAIKSIAPAPGKNVKRGRGGPCGRGGGGQGGGGGVDVLVFDEVDANIGGRLGSVIGRKMRDLATGSGRQVLCITHLPQIAAFADRHLHIAKRVEGRGKARQTRTTVSELTGKARIDELAEMMAGREATATTRRQAREMVGAAMGGTTGETSERSDA